MPTKNLWIACAAAAAVMVSVPAPAAAQGAGAILRPGVWEVGAFGGASYGIDQTRGMGGGNVVYSLNRTLMPFAEFSYFPGIGRTETVQGLGTPFVASFNLIDFNGGFHVRIPIPRSRVIPYGVISVGAIHTLGQTVTIPGFPAPLTLDPETQFAVSGGGGIRYYTTERFGFRGEFKAYKPTGGDKTAGTYTAPFYRVTFGFFFQF